MSFLKIKNPEKRDEIVKEYLETKKKIRADNMLEKIGDDYEQQEYRKIFKPITTQSEKQIKAIENLTEKMDQPLELKMHEPLAIEDSGKTSFGPIATEYMKKYLTPEGADKTFGFSQRNGNFYMGDKEINFENDDIIVGETRYKGTKGLWDLIVSKNPNAENFYDEDLKQYANLLLETNAMKQSGSNKPKSSKSIKWNQIIKPIWDKFYKGRIREVTGEGIIDDLINRFDLLIKSKKAGNTNTKKESTSILKRLFKENVINNDEYKKLLLKC